MDFTNKEERNEYARQYRAKNLEAVRAKGREYSRKNREADPEKSRASGLKSYYKYRELRIQQMRERYYANQEQQKEYYREYRKKNQHKTATRVKAVACEACGDVDGRIVLDHCHSTGAFRGWLCHNCNVSLGLLKESTGRLKNLVTYLENMCHPLKAGMKQ